MEKAINKILYLVVSILFIILLLNIVFSLVWNSWQNYDISICKNHSGLIAYFGVMFFCLIFLIKDRLIKLSMSSDGVSAELQKIEKTKEEIFATKEEILGIKNELLNLYKTILKMTITSVENSRRWAGWAEHRYNKHIQDMNDKCNQLNISKAERDDIFQTKILWDKIECINKLKDEIESGIENQDLKKEIDEQWNKIVNESDEPSREWLEKYIDETTFEESVKNKLRDKIKF